MGTTIHPQTLRSLRSDCKLSQQDLAEKSRCSVAQISRWERGKSTNVHRSSLDRLSKALGVETDALTQPPASPSKHSADDVLGFMGLTQLNVRVRKRTRTALEVVSGLFGVTWAQVIELAPLLFLATAKKSLAERATAIDSVEQQRERLLADIVRTAPHLAADFRAGTYYGDDAISEEGESIARRDVFGPDFAFREYEVEADPDQAPYVLLLQRLLGDWSGKIFEIEPQGYGQAPEYHVVEDFLEETFGVVGSSDKKQHILNLVASGEIDLRDLRAKKEAMPASEYTTWLQVTYENALQSITTRAERLGINLDF